MSTPEVILRVACWAAASTFVVRYAFVRWWKSSEGKNIMAFTFLIWEVLTLINISLIWHPFWSKGLSNFIYIQMLIILVHRCYLLFKAQNKDRQANPETRVTIPPVEIKEEGISG